MTTKKQKPIWLYIGGLVALVIAVGGVIFIAASRSMAEEKERNLRTETLDKGPRVRVVDAIMSPAERHLELQGEARPFASVTLYAKVSGYLKQIRVDKGDRVKNDQVLAVIESPELDRQYDAAVADAAYKKVNAARAANLVGPGVVSAQEADLQKSQAAVADAQVSSLKSQKEYESLRAPFAGTVTARFADPGALMQNATSAQTGALPVLTVSQIDRLRVYVYADQRDAAYIKPGNDVKIVIADRNLIVDGKVTRQSNELDPQTRKMLVEIDVENRDGKIVPGSYVSVRITVPTPQQVELPVEALMVREKKPMVALLTKEERIRFRPVVISYDDGAHVGIESGISVGDRVALDVGDRVGEDGRVQPIVPVAPAAPSAPSGATPAAKAEDAKKH